MIVFFEGSGMKTTLIEKLKESYSHDFIDSQVITPKITDFYNRQSKVLEIANENLYNIYQNRLTTKKYLTICSDMLYTGFRELVTTRKELSFLVNHYLNNSLFGYLKKIDEIKIVFCENTNYNDTVILYNLDVKAFNVFYSKLRNYTKKIAINNATLEDLEKIIF